MTNELIRALSDMEMLINDWRAKALPTEEEFVDKLKKVTANLVMGLGNQKEKEIQADE